MKNRWIGGLALAIAFTLGACAPTQQGAEESDEPAPAAETAPPSESAEAMESSEASESAEPTPEDYEY